MQIFGTNWKKLKNLGLNRHLYNRYMTDRIISSSLRAHIEERVVGEVDEPLAMHTSKAKIRKSNNYLIQNQLLIW